MEFVMGKGAARFLAVASLAATALITAPSAGAAVTIGQTGTPDVACSQFDRLQPTVLSGTSYVVPSTVASGTITSWTAQGGATPTQMGMKVFRSVGGATYQAVGHDGPRAITANALNRFSTNVAVKAGDILGDFTTATTDPVCTFAATGETYLRFAGNLSDGSQASFDVFAGDRRLNVTAVIEPTNTLTIGAVTRNKKNGTATVAVTVPNPGTLGLSGGGAKAQVASGPVAGKAVSAPGTVQLRVKASGKKKTRLRTTGKVKVNPTITFTPTGGTASSQTVQIKLKKKI
jgi:hypothetical protein